MAYIVCPFMRQLGQRHEETTNLGVALHYLIYSGADNSHCNTAKCGTVPDNGIKSFFPGGLIILIYMKNC